MPAGGAALWRSGDRAAGVEEASTSGRGGGFRFRLSDAPKHALAGAVALARLLARQDSHGDNTVLAGTLARTAAQVRPRKRN
jgi:hypothetical protein